MEVRDKLNSHNGYWEIINRKNGYISEDLEKIKKIEDADKQDIQLFNLPNHKVIQNTRDSILNYSFDNFVAKYSANEDINLLKKEIVPLISFMEQSWEKRSGYIEMVWMLSTGIMLEIDDSTFYRLATLVEKDNPNDFLIDFLISYRCASWEKKSNKFMFSRPYQATSEIVSFTQTDKTKGLERLKKYLSKEWYRGHSGVGWYDSHKSKWNIHTGYWSFESGALVKILGLDDSSLKDTPYYPYDLVHWKDEPSIPKRS